MTSPSSLFSIHQTLNVVLANCADHMQISDRRIPLEEHLTRVHNELRRMYDDVNRAEAVGDLLVQKITWTQRLQTGSMNHVNKMATTTWRMSEMNKK